MHERSSGASPLRPEIPEPLPNVTVAVGREATLPCVVRNLGDYKVYQEFCQYQIFRRHFKSLKMIITNCLKLFKIFFFQVAFVHIDRQMILTIHNHVITRIPRFSISHDKHLTWTLKIEKVTEEDKGFYMCQVNTDPMVSTVGHIDVVGKLMNIYSASKLMY